MRTSGASSSRDASLARAPAIPAHPPPFPPAYNGSGLPGNRQRYLSIDRPIFDSPVSAPVPALYSSAQLEPPYRVTTPLSPKLAQTFTNFSKPTLADVSQVHIILRDKHGRDPVLPATASRRNVLDAVIRSLFRIQNSTAALSLNDAVRHGYTGGWQQVLDEGEASLLATLENLGAGLEKKRAKQMLKLLGSHAALICLFALGRPIFSVEGPAKSMLSQLGWLPPGSGASYGQHLRLHIESRVPQDLRYKLRSLLIQHEAECRRCQGAKIGEDGEDEECCLEELVVARKGGKKSKLKVGARKKKRKKADVSEDESSSEDEWEGPQRDAEDDKEAQMADVLVNPTEAVHRGFSGHTVNSRTSRYPSRSLKRSRARAPSPPAVKTEEEEELSTSSSLQIKQSSRSEVLIDIPAQAPRSIKTSPSSSRRSATSPAPPPPSHAIHAVSDTSSSTSTSSRALREPISTPPTSSCSASSDADLPSRDELMAELIRLRAENALLRGEQ